MAKVRDPTARGKMYIIYNIYILYVYMRQGLNSLILGMVIPLLIEICGMDV